MRILVAAVCVLSIMAVSMEARSKRKTPASQNTAISKAHRKAAKVIVKSRKAPKVHRQKVN